MDKVCLTEQEILDLPNDFELGHEVRRKLWEEKKSQNNTKQNEDAQESKDGGN